MLTRAITIALTAMTASVGVAQEISFQRPDASPLSNAITEQFVRPMIGIEGGEDLSQAYSWARHDVDGDAYDELFIRIDQGMACADQGCPIIGFAITPEGNWTPILTTVGDRLVAEDGELHVLIGEHRRSWLHSEDEGTMIPMGSAGDPAAIDGPDRRS